MAMDVTVEMMIPNLSQHGHQNAIHHVRAIRIKYVVVLGVLTFSRKNAIQVFVEMVGAKLKKLVINFSMILTKRIY